MWPNGEDDEATYAMWQAEQAWEDAKATDGEALSGVTAADNETARAKPTPRVEARLLAKARGFDGDDTNTINERLNNGND